MPAPQAWSLALGMPAGQAWHRAAGRLVGGLMQRNGRRWRLAALVCGLLPLIVGFLLFQAFCVARVDPMMLLALATLWLYVGTGIALLGLVLLIVGVVKDWMAGTMPRRALLWRAGLVLSLLACWGLVIWGLFPHVRWDATTLQCDSGGTLYRMDEAVCLSFTGEGFTLTPQNLTIADVAITSQDGAVVPATWELVYCPESIYGYYGAASLSVRIPPGWLDRTPIAVTARVDYGRTVQTLTARIEKAESYGPGEYDWKVKSMDILPQTTAE